ncbi:hypothetical protein V1460_15035 [Streptomyces sp. SCSIO 30461]|uniref:hypothetical protein n=1 Tax=Streptomyces sp. SCSIO 30461 TaxID=3118085 RepID=UPI0030D1E0C5
MSGRRSLAWLGLTPEPERELPSTVAALRSLAPDADTTAPELTAAERHRMERLILHGSERSWLRYLAEVTELVTAVASGARRGDPAAALLAGEVVLDHHRMLIGLPGSGYGRTSKDRRALETAVLALRGTAADHGTAAAHTGTDTTGPGAAVDTAANDTTDSGAGSTTPETQRPPHVQQGRQGGQG